MNLDLDEDMAPAPIGASEEAMWIATAIVVEKLGIPMRHPRGALHPAPDLRGLIDRAIIAWLLAVAITFYVWTKTTREAFA